MFSRLTKGDASKRNVWSAEAAPPLWDGRFESGGVASALQKNFSSREVKVCSRRSRLRVRRGVETPPSRSSQFAAGRNGPRRLALLADPAECLLAGQSRSGHEVRDSALAQFRCQHQALLGRHRPDACLMRGADFLGNSRLHSASIASHPVGPEAVMECGGSASALGRAVRKRRRCLRTPNYFSRTTASTSRFFPSTS